MFVISLDFEVMWGVIDNSTPQGYGRTNVAHVPQVLDRVLDLFDKYEIHATIAPVGLLMHIDKQEAMRNIPATAPSYEQTNLSPYNNGYINAIEVENEHLYFVPQLIEKLKSYPNIELGTHTYCHYYCTAAGQTVEQFDADLERAVAISRAHGFTPTSIIFPRNEVNRDYLAVCSKHGIKVYRGNAKKFFNPVSGRWATLWQRVCRLLDSYVNIGGYSTFALDEIKTDNGVINVPASRFLRPYSQRLSLLESLRLRRIKREMTHAAKHGELYHLWWHPHNFGANVDENCKFLEEVLRHFASCRDKYGMRSLTMGEAGREIQTTN